MSILFDVGSVLTAEVVVSVADKGYVIVKNCDPKMIFCHIYDGGRLTLTKENRVTFGPAQLKLPAVKDKIALIKVRQDDKKYDKGLMWVPVSEWDKCSWTVNGNETFQAIGFDHTTNGIPNANAKEVVVVTDTLYQIVKRINGSKVGRTHEQTIDGIKYSYSIRWEHRQKDGSWIDCPCPLPRHLQR